MAGRAASGTKQSLLSSPSSVSKKTHPRTKQRRTRVENNRKMRATFLLLFLLLLSGHAPAPALALPPRPPVRCATGGGCVLSNAYGAWSSDRADCPVSAVAYPASEPEVVAAVARASAAGARVKVVSGFAHTIPKLACPSGGGNASTLLISTARLAGVEVDAAARTVTADAGALLRAVIDAAEARGLSLAAAPYWEGVSVGGLVSTGSHAQLVVGAGRRRARPRGGPQARRARRRGHRLGHRPAAA